MRVSGWLKTASATFAGGAVAIGLVAIPTFVWLPREFDKIYVEAAGARGESTLARSASEEAKAASLASFEKIDGLIVSIARMDAKPLIDFTIEGDSGNIMLSEAGEKGRRINDLMPPDVVSILQASGKMENFKYSNFGGKDWIFIDQKSFNEFTLDEQKKIEESLNRTSVQFNLE